MEFSYVRLSFFDFQFVKVFNSQYNLVPLQPKRTEMVKMNNEKYRLVLFIL